MTLLLRNCSEELNIVYGLLLAMHLRVSAVLARVKTNRLHTGEYLKKGIGVDDRDLTSEGNVRSAQRHEIDATNL